MKTKHRIIKIVTIFAIVAFIVFLARSCGEPASASIDEPNDTDIENARKLGDNLINYADRLIHQIAAIDQRLKALEDWQKEQPTWDSNIVLDWQYTITHTNEGKQE